MQNRPQAIHRIRVFAFPEQTVMQPIAWTLAAVVALTLAIGATPGAAAEDMVSQYTSADVKKCRKLGSTKIDGSEYGAAWACKGLAG
jgi:hypothetical protein